MTFEIHYFCHACGYECVNAKAFECPSCGERALMGQPPAGFVHDNLVWDRPKRIHALRPDHPDHFAWDPDDAKRKLERNNLLIRPDDQSGVKSPLGEARETAKPFSSDEVGKDPRSRVHETKIRKVRPKRP